MFDFKFDWNRSLEIGIPLIDEQHQMLFSIGREIEQLLLTQCLSTDDTDLLKLLCKIRDYITYHFYEEEEYMKSINYPAFEAHKHSHDQFTATINTIDCIALCRNPNEEFTQLKEYLQSWLFEHVLIEDAAFAKKF